MTTFVEAPKDYAFAPEDGELDWEIDDDDEWFFAVVSRTQAREKSYVAALKAFSEGDWVRNSGRFARYVGRGPGGRSGGAGEGEGVEDAVAPITERQRKNAEAWFKERGLSRASMAAQARSMMTDPQDLEDGKVWYQKAHDYASELGAQHGISTDAAAGAIAALSPQMEWELNKRTAESLIRQTTAERFNLMQEEVDARMAEIEKRGGMSPAKVAEHRAFLQSYVGSTRTASIPTKDLAKLVGGSQVYGNKEKAIRIVRGERPRKVLGGIPPVSTSGMKVRSFYDNITRPSTSQEVTIDRRMVDALVGGGRALSDSEHAAILSNPARYQMAADAVRDATPRGLLPHQSQATVWGAQGPAARGARGKAAGETFVNEDTGTLDDWDAYAAEVAESMLLGGATSEEVDELLRSQRRYLRVGREATKTQTDALLYVLDLWSKEKLKFNESDWVRNSGRFARYVGQGPGGSSGGAGAADDPRVTGTAYLDEHGIKPHPPALNQAASAFAAPKIAFGHDPLAARRKAKERLTELTRDTDLSMRVKQDTFEHKMLPSGTIGNTFVRGGGSDLRLRVEHDAFSYSQKRETVDPNDRPKYGYLSARGEDNAGDANMYGDTRIVLKPTLRERTTFMVGDSYSLPEGGIPSPLNNPDGVTWDHLQDRDYTIAEIAEVQGYVETQIHGPLSMTDIERVEFNRTPTQATVDRLAELGVPWEVKIR